ncbi:MAG: CRISPR-associated endonuclease Cas2 [Candidatus Humimicrobiaceae bacterium]
MLVVVSYDINIKSIGGQRRLRRVAKICKNFGQRVQFSVFECLVDPTQWILMRKKLIEEIDPERDSLRFYFLGSNWKQHVEHIGAKEVIDLEDILIF